jgi:hypothetical protein
MRCPDFHGRRFLPLLMIVANPGVAGQLGTARFDQKDWVRLFELKSHDQSSSPSTKLEAREPASSGDVIAPGRGDAMASTLAAGISVIAFPL